MRKYAVLVTLHDGSQEVYGPFSNSRVERARERAETLGWVTRASVVPIYSAGTFRLDYVHAKGGN